MKIEVPNDLTFLSELYATDCPEAVLLTEYPSSNSDQTIFRNSTHFIIHDPFPPPPRELLKCLGPHHLMCGWGSKVPVTSEVKPPDVLLDHWKAIFGEQGVPNWVEFDRSNSFITLFPHQSLSAESQIIDPVHSYEQHSKEIIAKIDCAQPKVFEQATYPCFAKLTHGYAGLGNYLLNSREDEYEMRAELSRHWPDAKLVFSAIIDDVVSDHGVQFYLRRDGSVVWIGLTEQQFNESNRWCGGIYSHELQTALIELFSPIVIATASKLHQGGYFGLVGVDVLTDAEGDCFLVDVNPRLTGITPFLMASRFFAEQHNYYEGVYQASFRFGGTVEKLMEACAELADCVALVLSAVEQRLGNQASTVCHLSISSASQRTNRTAFEQLASYGL